LPPIFLKSSFEYCNQRARLELIGDSSHVGETLRFAKRSQKPPALHSRPAQQAPLGKDNGPGHQAEK
jgi:hypothetical protein